jgi:peptide/nickel transport system permease protein
VTGLGQVVVDRLWHLALPCVCLVSVAYAQYFMVMRSSTLATIGSDYLTTARAKGLRETAVRRRHAVPNALLPSVTLIFLNLGGMVSGGVLVETVFSWPGLGLLFYEALTVPDVPLLQGLFLFFSASVIVANLVADLSYPWLDPRTRAT